MSSASEGDSYVGEDPEDGALEARPDLHRAIERAAERASKAGHAGEMFTVAIELEPADHNQWVKTYRVIISPK